MASILELAGVALAALLSENFVLVSCMGIAQAPRHSETQWTRCVPDIA